MPYLHWEIEKRLGRMSQIVQRTQLEKDKIENYERRTKRLGTWGSVVSAAQSAHRAGDLSRGEQVSTIAWNTPSWRPQSPLGSYLWYAAKLFQLIDEAADEMLIRQHLYADPPLHIRRTLEQYYYWTTEDTGPRDRKQVVYRGTRLRRDPEALPRVIMVDQLWLWILDDSEFSGAYSSIPVFNYPTLSYSAFGGGWNLAFGATVRFSYPDVSSGFAGCSVPF
jgi:hypothetical protein